MMGRGGLVLCLLLCSTANARAERRAFAGTAEFLTMTKEDVQIDSSITQSYDVFDTNKLRDFVLQLSVAYGITDRFDIAAFQVYQETINEDVMLPSTPFHYKEARVRTRYRFAERGELPVDIMGQLDGRKPFDASGWGLVPRVVVSRDVDKLVIVGNAFADFSLGQDPNKIDLGWAVATTYEVVPELKLGAESFGTKRVKGGDTSLAWLGPAISWAPTKRAWLTLGISFGLTQAAIDLRTDAVIGMTL
jgi:hypothetical protein